MERSLKVEDELFVMGRDQLKQEFPDYLLNGLSDDDYIVTTPLRRSGALVSGGVVKYLQDVSQGADPNQDVPIRNQLIRLGMLYRNDAPKRNVVHENVYAPTRVTLMPTWNCNLRCLYCYSNGGENPGPMMDFAVAKSAIDFIAENAGLRGAPSIGVGFHGGGEPLLHANMDFIKQTVEYLRGVGNKTGLKTSVSSATNGVFSHPEDLEWITQNFGNLNISLDGTADVQNAQRPKLSGGNLVASFPDVMRTVGYLEDKKFPYGVRATITDDSVSRMPEFVEFLKANTSLKRAHLEPLFECGRCKTTKIRAPKPDEFVKYFIEAKRLGRKIGMELYYSGGSLEASHDTFCGACGSNFFIAPNGKVTTCLEVSREDDDMHDLFVVGRHDPKSPTGFITDDGKLKTLRNRTVDKVKGCEDCFAKYSCAGDCLAKSHAETGSLTSSDGNKRCWPNKAILLEETIHRLTAPNDKKEGGCCKDVSRKGC